MARRQSNSKLLLMVVVLVTTLSGLLYFNINLGKEKIVDIPRYMVIGKKNVFVIYEDKLSLSIPFGVQMSSEKTIGCSI